MATFTNVCIGVQARSTSARFPGKVLEDLDGKTVLDHVLWACNSAADYNNRYRHKHSIVANVVLLIPRGDPIGPAFKNRAIIFEGNEDDVLGRYMGMAQKFNADYIVRVTADCPLLPPFLIYKHINCATKNQYDYISNVDEKMRTAADGHDCEVFSRKLLDYTAENARDRKDREHVTTFMRREPPAWAKTGYIVHSLDSSNLKLSIDTPEDLERVREEYRKIKSKTDGKKNVHRV